jgi:hypothetical protein
MVVEDALDFVHGLFVGRDIDGLVKAPDHEGDGDGGVETDGELLHWGILMRRFQFTTVGAGRVLDR